MRTTSPRTARWLAAAATLLATTPALAALQDRGPQDPTLVFPQWYRDSNQTAVGLCKSQAQSPNPAAALAPMCFPLATDPTGFAGNLGPELFYNDLNVAVTGGAGGFTLRYLAALEATYLPAGQPIHGTETVFARIRVVANIAVAGTYTVTHPFGVEVFPNVQPSGPRSIFFTADVPLGPAMDFDSALGGRVGPFIQWDVLNPGESLTVGAEQFLGDPNFAHTFTGSPFGTNYVRIDGPPGSNLDGAGNDFVVQPLGTVLGQKWTAAIPTPFTIKKSVYSRGAALNTVDLWATSSAGQRLFASGAGMPSLLLAEFPGGNYYGHIEFPSTAIPPATVTVTNLTSVPVTSVTSQLVDQLDALAAFDPLSRVLSMTASSSDLSGPTLTVVAPFGGLMTPGAAAGTYAFTSLPLAATVETPMQVRVESNAGGVYLANTVVGSGNPMNAAGAPVAVDDAPVVAGSGATAIPVGANDTFSGVPTFIVLSQPVTGTAVATAAGITYTANVGASGPDSFTYAIQDAVGVSNVATVSFTVPFVPAGPTANPDNTATQINTTRVVNVLANDTAATGTVIDPLSVQVTGVGASVNPATGAVSYTAGGATGVFTFSYTVADTTGVRSAPATVTMVVFGGPESVSIGTAQYTVAQAKWKIVGSTNWFNAALTQASATCWTGTAAAPTASTLIGTAPVDTTGKFQLVPVGATPKPVNPSSITCKTTYGGSKSATVSFK